jgi:hypothetical protein
MKIDIYKDEGIFYVFIKNQHIFTFLKTINHSNVMTERRKYMNYIRKNEYYHLNLKGHKLISSEYMIKELSK